MTLAWLFFEIFPVVQVENQESARPDDLQHALQLRQIGFVGKVPEALPEAYDRVEAFACEGELAHIRTNDRTGLPGPGQYTSVSVQADNSQTQCGEPAGMASVATRQIEYTTIGHHE
jgi:hypothetical protein